MNAMAGTSRNEMLGVVYFVQSGERPLVKIGFATDAAVRVRDLQCGNPDPLHLMGTVPGTLLDEMAWHRRFKHLSVRNEWFTLDADLTAAIEQREVIAAEILDSRLPPSISIEDEDQFTRWGRIIAETRYNNKARAAVARSPLTPADVRRIFKDKRSMRAIAVHYGIGTMTVHGIKAGRTWRHVTKVTPSSGRDMR